MINFTLNICACCHKMLFFKDWIKEKWEIRERRDQMVTCHYKQDDVDQGSVDNFVILHSHDISPFS